MRSPTGEVKACASDDRPAAVVPGVVIAHSPASSGRYIGSPSLAVLPGGDYVASHDFFGPESGEFRRAQSAIYRSMDRGATWRRIAEIDGAFWSTLFVHRGALYLMGTDRHHGDVVIRRSTDGGRSWTTPENDRTGLLRGGGEYHGAPVPVLEHGGRIWRGFERRDPPVGWGVNYRAGMLSADIDADLLCAVSWTAAGFMPSSREWNGGDMGGWLEGNAVAAPDGRVLDILRVETQLYPERAAVAEVSADGRAFLFDPERGFIDFPGGAKKFTIRFDPRSALYWSVVTDAAEADRGAGRPTKVRNTLALTCSSDLRAWTTRRTLLRHPDVARHGFQYVDWQFDDRDIIAVCRTAYDDAEGGARNHHDANYMTFHRIGDFRVPSPPPCKPRAPSL